MKRSVAAHKLRRVTTAVALALIPVLFVGIFLSVRSEFAEVRELRRTAEQTAQTRDQLARLLVMHVDAETAVRGYVVTGNTSFLAPYAATLERRDESFSVLERESDPKVRTRLPELERLSDAKLANAAVNIEDVRKGRTSQARLRIASGRGKALMDRMRAEIADLDRIETARLKALTAAGSGSRDQIERTVMTLLIGLAVLLALVTLLVNASIRARREALDRAERLGERNNAMFEGAVDGMLLLDETGQIVRMNPSISRMFGYEDEELIGRHNMFLMADEFTDEQSHAWLSSVGAAGTHGAGRRYEFTGCRKDGTTFETEVAISRLSANEGRRYIAVIRDISDRKRAERLKTEFVSTVSHELRTPLTSIGGSLGLLAAGAAGEMTDQARRLVSIAHSNCERLIRLINDILDIEKIESGKMEFDLRKLQVAPLVERTIANLNGFAGQHDVALKATLPPWPQCVSGDADRLEQLLTNLVSNAIKHSPKGGTVEIFADHHRNKVRIEVRDRGMGVPDEFRGRIFGKFAMADASDSRVKGGTGLGLSIAREIARRHGGEVGFEDRDGGGTTFHCDIPAVQTERAHAPPDKSSDLPTLLHIDDDEDCLSVVESAFFGKATVYSVATLFEAMQIIRREDIHAAIIDIGLDGENGMELVPTLREHNPDIPIVLFTALDAGRHVAGVDRALVKSRVPMTELVDTTLELLERRRKAA